MDDAGANKLGLWWLQSMDELVVGKWKISRAAARAVGRSRQGSRTCRAARSRDRPRRRPSAAAAGEWETARAITTGCSRSVRPDCPLIGLCYECQLFDDLIVGPHDVFMDKVVTESAVYEGQRPDEWRLTAPVTHRNCHARSYRRHLRRGVSQHLRRVPDHGSRSAVGRACRATPRRETARARSCAIAKPGWIDSSARAAMNRLSRPMVGRVRSCNCTCRGFARTASRRWNSAALVRISQNVLTCPTAACFNLIDSRRIIFRWAERSPISATGFKSGSNALAARCGGFPRSAASSSSTGGWVTRDGLMGGNLWFFGETEDAALAAAEAGVAAVGDCPGVIMPFPGGIAGSGSKAGSKYKFMIASTYEKYCPLLVDDPKANSQLPDRRRLGDGNHHQRPRSRSDHPSHASRHRRLGQHARPADASPPATTAAGSGKSFIYLHPDKQPVAVES